MLRIPLAIAAAVIGAASAAPAVAQTPITQPQAAQTPAEACPNTVTIVHEYGESTIPRRWVAPLPVEFGACPLKVQLSIALTFQVVIDGVSGGRMQFQSSPDPDGVDAETPRVTDADIIRQSLLVRNRNVAKVIQVEGRGYIYDISGRLYTPPADESYLIVPALPEGAPDINRAMFCHGKAQGALYCRFGWQVTPDYKVLASDSFIATGDPKQLFERFETAQEGIRRTLNLAGEDVRQFKPPPPEQQAQRRGQRPQMILRSPTGRIIVQGPPPANPRAAFRQPDQGFGFEEPGAQLRGPALAPQRAQPQVQSSSQSKLEEAIALRNLLRNQLELLRKQRPLVANDDVALARLAAQEVELLSRLRNQQAVLRGLIAEAEENSQASREQPAVVSATPTPRPTPIIRGRSDRRNRDASSNPFDAD